MPDNELINPIESEAHRERLIEDVKRWAKHTKASFMLRPGDIENLVSQIITEFYHIQLSCGHYVMDMDEGIELSYKDHNGEGGKVEVSGIYCKVCAERYKKEFGAWEIK